MRWILKSFSRQVILVLFSVTFIMGMLTIAKFYVDEKEQLSDLLETQVSQMSHRFAISIANKVFYNNYFELSDDIFSLYDYNHMTAIKTGALYKIENIAVVDNDQNIVGHSNPIDYAINTKYRDAFHYQEMDKNSEIVWNDKHDMLHIKTAIYFSNDKIAHVSMDINPLLFQESKSLLFKNIIVFIVVFIIILIILSLFFAKWIDRPLLEVISSLHKVGTGEVSFSLTLKREDEFHLLADALSQADHRIFEQNKSLLSIQKDLELKVEARTLELKEKANNLEETLANLQIAQKQLVETEKMSALGNLVAGIAHEVNTPLGISITGVTHIQSETKKVIKDLADDTLAKSTLDEYLDGMTQVSRSMYLSLNNAANLIRSFKQVAIDQHTEDKRTFDLREYVDEVLLSLHNKLRETSVRVINEIDTGIMIHSYAGIYSQMLTNFIFNSLIHAFTDNKEGVITIKAELKDDSLLIRYEDNGKGLDESTLNKMFNPFFTTRRGQGGSGLGLSVVYNLITHKLKGQINCESVLGKGMTLLVKIPFSELQEDE